MRLIQGRSFLCSLLVIGLSLDLRPCLSLVVRCFACCRPPLVQRQSATSDIIKPWIGRDLSRHGAFQELRSHQASSSDDFEQRRDEDTQRPLANSIIFHTIPATLPVDPSKDATDVSWPPAWLESLPNGVYTVLRIEMDSENETLIWGLDYHLERLDTSFSIWWKHGNGNKNEFGHNMESILALARRETSHVLNELLHEALRYTMLREHILMATILWYPDNQQIQVHGHIKAVTVLPPTPISATLAVLATNKSITNEGLPNRQRLAESKFSSWCEERRPLETQFHSEVATQTGHEVILTNVSSWGLKDGATQVQLNLLEGLTSNLFLVFPDRVVRTASTPHVLAGFVRSMALECLIDMGYTINHDTSMSVSSTKDIVTALSQCEEIFVTSAIKLVVPVKSVYVNRTMVWSYDWDHVKAAGHFPLALHLRSEILRQRDRFVVPAPTSEFGTRVTR